MSALASDSARSALTRARESREGICEHGRKTRNAVPSDAVLDYIADQKFSAGFDISPANVCPHCCEYRSVNLRCGCEYGGQSAR